MRYISICSGIEAATVAWHPLGWEPVMFAEIERFPSSLLAHHYPGVPNVGDFTKIKGDEFGAVDVLVAGTPCQSFSVAGLRGGLSDERGNLALEFLRFANRARPRWLVWENVPGVLSSLSHHAPDASPPPPPMDLERDGQEVETDDEYDAEELHALNCFMAGLSELGYGWAMRVLDAKHFGVPQRRRRVFVVGHLGDWRRAAAVLFERDCLSGNSAPRRETRESTAYNLAPCLGASGRGFERAGDPRGQDCVIAGTYWDGSDTADTLDASNASKQQMMPEKRRFQAMVTHSLRGEGFDASEDGTGRGTPLVAFTLHGSDRTVSTATETDIAGSVRTKAPGSIENSSTTVVMTLGDSQSSVMTPQMQARRLTPVECERLMGFPDNYTKLSDKTPDGPRYKALGNSMAVTVMAWLGKRIQMVEEINS